MASTYRVGFNTQTYIPVDPLRNSVKEVYATTCTKTSTISYLVSTEHKKAIKECFRELNLSYEKSKANKHEVFFVVKGLPEVKQSLEAALKKNLISRTFYCCIVQNFPYSYAGNTHISKVGKSVDTRSYDERFSPQERAQIQRIFLGFEEDFVAKNKRALREYDESCPLSATKPASGKDEDTTKKGV